MIIPDSVVQIGMAAFTNCSSLRSVTLGKGLTAIPGSAFRECISLTDVIIKSQLTIIDSYAFENCSSLVNINFPDSITTIGDSAFQRCTSLRVAKLGNNVTKIGGYAFSRCTSLEKLYMPYFLAEYGWNIVSQSPNVTAYIYSDATIALQWAKENGVRYQLLGSFKPNAVDNLRAVGSGKNKVTLTWNEAAGAEGYLVYGIRGNEKYGYIGMTTMGTKFTDTKAKDTEYNFYWVFPYIKNDRGQMVVGGTPKYVYAKGIIPAVQNLKASAVKGGVKLNWSKRSDAEGYLVYGIRPGGKYNYIGMTTTGTTFTDKKASKKEYNFYWVFPYHKNSQGKMIVGGTAPYTYGKAK